ncbi:hypothetical protein G9F71_008325 [Clostridium sp. FP2]|uniref:zinc-ribbon domain-containing protein n=1 Tax=Clostridium sp. FP2 TaxID=2724481 RepID=UPI0013E951C3|nr:zinc-ribbon domain-containing protein [Clostridium sp. FP2]MBZ9622857.1 hypothetical protein [Clostridium sp. FP2]
MLLTKEMEVSIGMKNMKYYEEKGYIIPKVKDGRGIMRIQRGSTKIKVKVEDLQGRSRGVVDVQCDECNTSKPLEWGVYTRCINEDGKYYCKPCASKLYGHANSILTKLKSGKSFADTNIKLLGDDFLKKYWSNKNTLDPFLFCNNSDKYVWVKCQSGHEDYCIRVDHFMTGSRCPICNSSKGERKISDILKKHGLIFLEQYRLDDCRNIKPLPFDFAVFNKLKLMCLIEYDGEHHYKPVKHFGGVESFKKTKRGDTIKNSYCMKNDIKLVRIPYFEFENIEEILNTSLMAMTFD